MTLFDRDPQLSILKHFLLPDFGLAPLETDLNGRHPIIIGGPALGESATIQNNNNNNNNNRSQRIKNAPVAAAFPTRRMKSNKSQEAQSCQSTEVWLERFLNLERPDIDCIDSRWGGNGRSHINRIGRQRIHNLMRLFVDVGVDSQSIKKTNFLQLRLAPHEYAHLLRSYPSVLTHSLERRLRPVTAFLQEEIGGGTDNWSAWRKVLYRYPRVYSYSVENKLRPNSDFFLSDEVGLSRPELSQVVGRFPPNLWLDTADLREKLVFLSSRLDLTEDELRGMIVSFVLGLSVENNLVPKMNFFLDPAPRGLGGDTSISSSDDCVHCRLKKNQLKELVLYQPALLAYSLDKRLKPRVRQLENANISFCYAPKNLMSFTDNKFAAWIENQTSTWSISESDR
ncbi:hypothetical protein THAOC_21969 [Thalassiosira oceanica]|uniref:Uncharacterized protein n=1 Tax=Thalassiosira oceanica TaxID=159749 RepID=K0RY53_THAOC|nr:hypothetical protein THAOC_21969 [Thalassiosira oceanica]|eukprot:EJK57945.1 hypothetical protein THAOC_21969 [Thalassiosira oceanica]